MAPPSIATIANNDSEHDVIVDVFRNHNVPIVADAAVVVDYDEANHLVRAVDDKVSAATAAANDGERDVLESCDAIGSNVSEEKQEQWGLPQKQGLYDPDNEHDACGVGFIVAIDGKRSHKVCNCVVTMGKCSSVP